jgi:hypothetical protein
LFNFLKSKKETEKKKQQIKEEQERIPGPRPTGRRGPRVLCGTSTPRRFKRGKGGPRRHGEKKLNHA